MIFYSGLFLEAQMDDVLHQIGERKPSVAVAEVIDESQLLPIHGMTDEYDPHVWFDVTLWAADSAQRRWRQPRQTMPILRPTPSAIEAS